MRVEECVKKLKSKGIIDSREIYICIIEKYNKFFVPNNNSILWLTKEPNPPAIMNKNKAVPI